MNHIDFDCVCAGIIVADHVCEPIDHLPAAGELVLTDRLNLTVGGCASNVAVNLARLGVRTAVLGVVGDDVFGQYVRTSLEAQRVDCRHVTTSSTSPTSGTLVVNCRGEDRRFIHCIGANDEFTGREVTPDVVRATRVLYLGGYCLSDALAAENVARAFADARSAGATTVLDVVLPGPGDYRRMLEPVLPVTDVFLPNDYEARILTGRDDAFDQAAALFAMGAGAVVVTAGEGGAVLVSDGVTIRADAHSVPMLDGTGGGDAFTAGYIFGLLQHGDVNTCLQYGAAAGAACVQAIGATTGALAAEELVAFSNENPLKIERVKS